MLNKNLLKELDREKHSLIVLISLKFLELFTNICLIFSVGNFLDQIVRGEYGVRAFLLQLIAIILIKIILIKYNFFVSHKISNRIKKSLRQRLFRKVYSFKMEYGEKISMSEMINLSVEGIEQLNIFYGELLPQLVFSLLGPLLLFIIMSFVNIKIAVTGLVFLPFIPIAIIMVQQLAKRVVKSYWKSYADLGEVFIDFLYGLTTLKIFNTDGKYNDKLNDMAEEFRIKTMKLLMLQLNNITVMDLVSYTGSATIIYMCLKYFAAGEISVFTGFVFILLSQEFFNPLRRLGALFHVAMNGISAATTLFEVLDMEEHKDGTSVIDECEVEIALKNLDFSYNKEPILENINLSCKENSITCLVGKSGSGKSTVLKLIMRFFAPQRGKILLNGEDIRDIDSKNLRDNISYVAQESHLFKGTIRENLLVANEGASETDLVEATRKANIYDFIMTLDQGFDTEIVKDKAMLSTGQIQRIALARMFLRKSKLYILDEPTANIDAYNEGIILKSLYEEKDDKTIIISSHRKSTLRICDNVINMQRSINS